MKRGRPKTLSGISSRCSEWPAIVRCDDDFGIAPGVASRSSEISLSEFPIARRDIAGTGDDAVVDGEHVGIDAKPLGGGIEKNLPDFRAGKADRTAGMLHGETA